MKPTLLLLALAACGDNLERTTIDDVTTWRGEVIGGASDDEVLDLALASDTLFVAGYRDGALIENIEPSGNAVGYVRALSLDGELRWERTFDTSGADTVEGLHAAEDLAIVGRTRGAFDGATNAGQVDAWVTRLALDGTGTPAILQLGDERAQHPVRIVRDATGTMLVAGYDDIYTQGPAVLDETNPTVARIRPDLTLEVYRREATVIGDQHLAVEPTSVAGEMIVGGNVAAGPSQGAYVRRLAADGTDRWQVRLSSLGFDAVTAMTYGPDGNLYAALSTYEALGDRSYGEQDFAVAVIDPETGAVIRAMQAGSKAPDYPRGISVAADGSVFVAGETLGSLARARPRGIYDLAVVRFAPDGTWDGAWQRGSDADDTARDVAIGPDAFYVGGYTHGALVPEVPVGGRRDGFVLRVPFELLISP